MLELSVMPGTRVTLTETGAVGGKVSCLRGEEGVGALGENGGEGCTMYPLHCRVQGAGEGVCKECEEGGRVGVIGCVSNNRAKDSAQCGLRAGGRHRIPYNESSGEADCVRRCLPMSDGNYLLAFCAVALRLCSTG